MTDFHLETRAEELFDADPHIPVSNALQLAREALAAAEEECRSRSDETDEVEAGEVWSVAASIIRSYAAGERQLQNKVNYADAFTFIEKPGASPHPSGDSSDKAADNLGSRTAERTSQPPAPPSEQRRPHDTGGTNESPSLAGAAAFAPSRPGAPLRQSHGKIRDNPRAGDLTDAEILERAAKWYDSRGDENASSRLRWDAAKLRAADEVDVCPRCGK